MKKLLKDWTADDKAFANILDQRQKEAAPDKRWDITREEFRRAIGLGFDFLPRLRLQYADLSAFEMHYTSFEKAEFHACDFSHTDLLGSSFRQARLMNTSFVGANLAGCSFIEANLDSTDFSGANLEGCSFYGAVISDTIGLKVVAPVGFHGRTIFGYVYQSQTRIQAGCRNATVKAMRTAIHEDYPETSPFLADYLDAVSLIEKWGKREKARLAALANADGIPF